MSDNSILVTGASGHIGNVLIRQLLAQGKHVRAMILPGEDTTSLHGLDIQKIIGNVLDSSSLSACFEGVQQVFHLAGIISIMPGKNPHVQHVNIDGTANVLAAAKQAGVKRLVYTSSIHALARIPHGRIIDESVAYDPENPYGAYDQSKARATLLVQEAAQAGFDAVIACPTGVIGPYDFRNSMMGDVIRSAALRHVTPYVDGAYDFVDVRDVAGGLISAAENGATGASYILSGHRISVRYLLETVREITGNGFAQFKIPFPLANFISRFTPFYYRLSNAVPRFTPYSLEVLQSNSFISHAKASRELGYLPRPIYESVEDTIHWFFEQNRPTRHPAA